MATSETSPGVPISRMRSSSVIARQHSPIIASGAMHAPSLAASMASARPGSVRGSA